MTTQLLSGDDTRFLAQQTDSQVEMMVGQMTTLLQNITDLRNDTEDKTAKLSNQSWFKRMCNTVLGKNTATRQEIQRNNDKMITYISQSVSQLYQMNLINERAICSLGNRMNEVYSQVTSMYQDQLNMKSQISEIMTIQQQTLETMGKFVTTLNEKIESVDKFHMLISEIQNGMYNDSCKLFDLCRILSQLDKRQMEDDRKMALLKDTMKKNAVITSESKTVTQWLLDILSLQEDSVGIIYLELSNYSNNFPANIFIETIENYHFLSEIEKKSKDKNSIIQRIITKYDLYADASFSITDIAETIIDLKANSFVDFVIAEFEDSTEALNEIVVSDDNSATETELIESPYKNVKVGDVIEFGRGYYDKDGRYVNKPIKWIAYEDYNGINLLCTICVKFMNLHHERDSCIAMRELDAKKWLDEDFLQNHFTDEERKWLEWGEFYIPEKDDIEDNKEIIIPNIDHERFFTLTPCKNDYTKYLCLITSRIYTGSFSSCYDPMTSKNGIRPRLILNNYD